MNICWIADVACIAPVTVAPASKVTVVLKYISMMSSVAGSGTEEVETGLAPRSLVSVVTCCTESCTMEVGTGAGALGLVSLDSW